MIPIIDPDAESVLLGPALIDIETGLDIRLPLGAQTPFGWRELESNQEAITRIDDMRKRNGITVDDNWPEPYTDVEIAGAPKKRGKPKPRPRAGRKVAKRREAQEKKMMPDLDAPMSTGERAAYLAWKSHLEDMGGYEIKGTPGVFPAQLRKYWLGEGLARWASTPTPYRALVRALKKEGVPRHMVNGLAARLYHWHFGTWPGKRNGGKKDWEITDALLTKFADYELEG